MPESSKNPHTLKFEQKKCFISAFDAAYMIGETSRKRVYTKGSSNNKYKYNEPVTQSEACEIETRERKKLSEVWKKKKGGRRVDQGVKGVTKTKPTVYINWVEDR